MKPRLISSALALASLILAAGTAQATTYTYAASNVTGTPTTPVNWSTASWDTVPVSGSANTIVFFEAGNTTALGNTATPSLQTVNNDIANPFQLGTLTLGGKGSATTSANLLETLAGGTLNFSAATGTIHTYGAAGTAQLAYYLNNNIQLGTASSACALTVGDNSATAYFYINSNISELKAGGGSLTKAYNNIVTLAGNNTYTGTTTVNSTSGILRLGSPYAVPGGLGATGGTSALTITNGVVELACTDLLRNLGTGASQFQITGGTSGFTTRGVRNVIVNNDPNVELVWGSTSFNPGTFRLMEGAIDAPITLSNKIDLNSASTARTISLNNNNNSASNTPAILTGVIRNSAGAGGLTKDNAGYLRLTGLNTFTGPVTLTDGGGSSGQMLSINSMPNGGVAGPLGMSSNAAASLKFGNDAGIHYIGSGDSSDRSFTFNSGSANTRAILEASGSGALNLTSTGSPAFNGAGVAHGLILCGSSPLANTLAATLTDNGAGALYVKKDRQVNANSIGGVWVLSGANTFTGPVTINNGILSVSSIDVVANANPLGKSTTAATNLVLGGGILQYTGSGGNCDRAFTLSGNAAIDASGSGALNLTNTSVANSYTSGKTLTLTGSSTANNTFSALLSTGVALTKAGKGTWVLNGPVVNTYTAATTLWTGTLVEDFSNMTSGYANLINSGSALTLGGGVLSLQGKASTACTQSFTGNPSFNTQAGSGISITGGTSSTMALTLTNTWSRSAPATLNITLGSGGTLTSSPTVDTSTPTPLVKGSGSVAFVTVNGTDWAKVSGGNVVAFTGSDYNTTFPASGSTSTVNYSLTGSGSVTTTETANTLKINTSTTGQSLAITASQTLTLNEGGLLFVGGNDYSITGGTLAGQGGTGELVVHQFGNGNLTIGSLIGGGATLTKTGSGTLTLSGANTFTGQTYAGGGGTLVLKNQLALQNSILNVNNSSIVFDSSVSGNAFTVGGLTSPSVAPYGGSGYDLALQNNAGTPAAITLTVATSSDCTYNGTLSGPGSLIKTGSARLLLAGYNTFTGGITINGGTLISAQNDDWGFGGGGPYGNQQFTVNSGGTLALNANVLFNATITLNGGTLASGSGFPSSLNGSIILGATSTIPSPSNAGDLAIYSLISGTGGLTKQNGFSSGNGAVILYNANTFSGPTIVNMAGGANDSGYLTLAHSFALQNSVLDTTNSTVGGAAHGIKTTMHALTLGGLSGNKDLASLFTTSANGGPNAVTPKGGYGGLAALALNPGASQTPSYSGVIADGTTGMALIKTGAGTQTFTAAQTYTGPTTISAGTLALGVASALPSATKVTLTGGTLDAQTFANSVGPLAVTGTATINLGSGATLAFADSSAVSWAGGTLNITGTLGATSLRFGTSSSGLTVTQLAQISVNGSGAGTCSLDSSGYLVADSTPPVWTATWPQVNTLTTTGLTARAKTNEAGIAYYVVLSGGATAPSAAQVKAGTDSTGAAAPKSGNMALTANAEAIAAVTGLSPGTTYDVWFVAQDAVPNLQASPTKVSVTTVTVYADWLTTNSATASDANFLTFAFGAAAPGGASGSAGYNAGVVTPGQPTTTLTTGDPVDFRAVFSRRSDYATAGLSYTLQFSADLNFADGYRQDLAVTTANGGTIKLLGTGTVNGVSVDVMSVSYPWLIPVGAEFKKPTFYRVKVNATNSSGQTPP